MDVLSDILSTLRFRGILYFSTEFHKPWGLRVPAFRRVARFHLVTRGNCWVSVAGLADPVSLEPGDLVLVPHGAEHKLADDPASPSNSVDEVVAAAGFTGRGALVYGGDDTGAPTKLICGHFEFEEGLEHPLLAQLPPALVVRWEDAVRDSPLEALFRFITREVTEGRPGHTTVVQRLSEVLFVQIVRVWANQRVQNHGLLAALADRHLGAALAAIHEQPSANWTLESLSRRAAMGRSAFAERFRKAVSLTPLQYVALWRVNHAKLLLVESQLSLEQIAERVGYDAGASFSRAFKKVTGTSPGAYRRTIQCGEAGV